jgi:catechol 2,3-dioxygenase-like lactoylglutathione lyase family enzyme
LLDHIGIIVSDLNRSSTFYSAALRPLGYNLTKDDKASAAFGVSEGYGKSSDPGGDFWLSEGTPMRPLAHFAFSAVSRIAVDEFFSVALAAGGKGNGGPALRTQYHPCYYAAFILDPDGYNIEAVCHLIV